MTDGEMAMLVRSMTSRLEGLTGEVRAIGQKVDRLDSYFLKPSMVIPVEGYELPLMGTDDPDPEPHGVGW